MVSYDKKLKVHWSNYRDDYQVVKRQRVQDKILIIFSVLRHSRMGIKEAEMRRQAYQTYLAIGSEKNNVEIFINVCLNRFMF